jgi:replicative DNA helicase
MSSTVRVENANYTYKGKTSIRSCYRIYFSGDGIEEIPVKIKRKKANPRKSIKDALVSGITVENKGLDNFYGFTIDGNKKFVLGNFVVAYANEFF